MGEVGMPLVLPPAYQEAAPLGTNMGGVNKAFFPIKPTAKYDSWITVGILGGDDHNSLGSIGIPWKDWTDTKGISVTDGGAFQSSSRLGVRTLRCCIRLMQRCTL